MNCYKCGKTTTKLSWLKEKDGWCPSCFYGDTPTLGSAPAVIGDECDVMIKHGVCNEDGTPRRFTSKVAIRQAAYEAGLFQGGDTPKVNSRLQEERAQKAEREGR